MNVVVVLLSDALWHVPRHERNIFVPGDDKRWGTQCYAEYSHAEWLTNQLQYGVPTCFRCIEAIEVHKTQFGRYPVMALER